MYREGMFLVKSMSYMYVKMTIHNSLKNGILKKKIKFYFFYQYN